MTRHIYINGRFLNQPMTGVQRYAHELLNNFDLLLDNAHWKEKVRICCLIPPGTQPTVSWRNIALRSIGINRNNIWEQLDLPLYLRGKFLFSPSNTGPFLYSNQAVTMHDASVFAVPHAYSFSFRLKHRLIFKSLARLAKIIITDSRFSQQQLSHYLDQPAERFHVIHLAGDHINKIEPEPTILEKHRLQKQKYLLAVASQSPHKNLRMIHSAARSIPGSLKIVLAGGAFRTVFQKTLSEKLPQQILVAGYISDSELRSLYQHALGYIFASYYEGFGLPVLEAMECGCPVLCAQAASLPEVAGDAALFFDPMKEDEIVGAIEQIRSDPKLRSQLTEKGTQRARQFSWASTANRTLNALYSVFESTQ